MTDIALRFKLTFEDYLSAIQLHAKRGLWPRMFSFLGNWLYPLFGVYFLYDAILEWRRHDAGGSVVISVFAGVFLVGGRFYPRWNTEAAIGGHERVVGTPASSLEKTISQLKSTIMKNPSTTGTQ